MTNYERIMHDMTVDEMAKLRTTADEETLPHENISFTVWVNDLGSYYDYGQAIEEEIKYLMGDEST